MKIAFHGGLCCGIKTIHDFHGHPDELLDELKNQPRESRDFDGNEDMRGDYVSSKWNLFLDAAPEETYLQRLDRYLAYLDVIRPCGIIEVVLADDECGYCSKRVDCENCYKQTVMWGDVLEERGFRIVTDCYNGNSGSRIFVYHRKRDKHES